MENQNTIAKQKIVLNVELPAGEVHMHPTTLQAIEAQASMVLVHEKCHQTVQDAA